MLVKYDNNARQFQLSSDDIKETVRKFWGFSPETFTQDQVTESLTKHYTTTKCLDAWQLEGALTFAPQYSATGRPDDALNYQIMVKAQSIHSIIKQRVQMLGDRLAAYNYSNGPHFAGIVTDPKTGAVTPVHADFFRQLEATKQDAEAETPASIQEAETATDFPMTMSQVSTLAAPYGRIRSKYDFGQFVIAHPRGAVSIEAAVKAFTRHHVNAIARALILKKYGVEFKKEQVFEAAKDAFKTYSNTKAYRIMLAENATEKRVTAAAEYVANLYDRIFNGTVDLKWKKFTEAYGKPWDIGTFYIYITDNLHIKVPRVPGKKKTKKGVNKT